VAGNAFSGYASVNVQNVGTLPLPYTQRVTVTLIAQNTATNVETTLGSTTASVSGLNPTYGVTVNVHGVTTGLATGNYTILATLTPVQAMNEISTANNNVTTPAKAITVAPAYVDLTGVFGTSYTLPASAVSGATIKGTVAVNVQNLGNVALPSGQTVTVTLIAKNTDTSDETTLGSATANVSALAASGSRLTSIAVNSAGLATGTYTILARLTPVQALNEISTANNDVTTPGHAITAALAYVDLSGTFGTTWTLPSNVVAGKLLAGATSVVVKNNGNVALPTGQKVNIVLLAHDIATNVDTPLVTLSNQLVSALAAGGTKQFAASVSRAAGLPADSYEIEATITPVQALAESNTNNNTATTPAHTVTSTAPFVDLSGVFGTTWTLPATIANSKAMLGYAPVVVKNVGNVALPTGQTVNIVVIAHDTTNPSNPDITLVTLVNQSLSALLAGGTRQFNAYVNRPAGLPADHYQIEATITPVQSLTESNLSNNTVLLNALGNTLGITVS
jgi:hypothetical protein